LKEIEQATKVSITFPERESGRDDVLLVGGDAEVQQARSMLLVMERKFFLFYCVKL